MQIDSFESNAREVVTWMARYLREVESYPVKSQVVPGVIKAQIPCEPPVTGQPLQEIILDLDRVLMPGMTHWQHPMFFAYFPANSCPASIFAEMITATLGQQCMLWETSPAATELEQRVMEWFRDMLGLPHSFTGVIQDTASISTLSALLVARERACNFQGIRTGLPSMPRMAVYCSSEAHSSVNKALRVIGLGDESLRTIAVDEGYSMRPEALERAIVADRELGITPMAVVATIGTTGCGAVDPIATLGPICKHYGVWLHVDAAYAGASLILPNMRWASAGIDLADSFVTNPHKWLPVNFDCSTLFVRDLISLQRTFEIYPEYLKTARDGHVQDFRNFGIQLGRRFRALKLWMVVRSYGIEGLQTLIRNHIEYAQEFEKQLRAEPDFEILAPCHFALVSFRYRPASNADDVELNRINRELLETLNRSGKLYLTHTALSGRYTLRLSIGHTTTTREHVQRALSEILTTARKLRHPLGVASMG
jgi:aromatic-L-amino-acid decarboxylase